MTRFAKKEIWTKNQLAITTLSIGIVVGIVLGAFVIPMLAGFNPFQANSIQKQSNSGSGQSNYLIDLQYLIIVAKNGTYIFYGSNHYYDITCTIVHYVSGNCWSFAPFVITESSNVFSCYEYQGFGKDPNDSQIWLAVYEHGCVKQ